MFIFLIKHLEFVFKRCCNQGMTNTHEQDNLRVLAEWQLKGYTAAGGSPRAPAPQPKAPVQNVYVDRKFGLPVGLHIFKALTQKLTNLRESFKSEYADAVKDCRMLGIQATWVTRVDEMLALVDLSRAIEGDNMFQRSELIKQKREEAFESLRWYNPTKSDRVALRARLMTAFLECRGLAEHHRVWCHEIYQRSDILQTRISRPYSDRPDLTGIDALTDLWQNCAFSKSMANWTVKGVPSISLEQRVLICSANGATTEDEFAQLDYSEMKLPAVNLKALQHITNSYRTKHNMPLLELPP